MPYTPFDHFVAWCRFRAVARHIAPQSNVCDIGSGPGAPFLHHVSGRLKTGVGLDEHVAPPDDERITVLQADITQPLPLDSNCFDHVTLLAVLEHLRKPEPVLAEAHRILRPGGSLIMTWPSAAVDPLLEVLTRIGWVNHDLGFDQHQPRIPVGKLRSSLQAIGFAEIENGTFELGLNNWLVARKGAATAAGKEAATTARKRLRMEAHTPTPRVLSVLKHAHKRAVFVRRVRVLAAALGAKIPAGAAVLDIGCGDGTLGSLIARDNPSITIQGIEFAPRPSCQIPCTAFDGESIPFTTASFDVAMFVDVLHHTSTAGITRLLAEAARVSRRYVLIKDHLSESALDFKTLQMMDWVANRPHGVVLPYNYQNRAQWNAHFAHAGLKIADWQSRVPLYPFPASAIFGRDLHFVALLQK